MSTHRSVAKSASVIGGLTLISRVLGFVRDILFATFFGTSFTADAFVVSFKLPNLFRDLVGEGAMNAAIVPVLTQTRAQEGRQEFLQLISALFARFVVLLFIITLFGVIFAPWVVSIIAPGFLQEPSKFDLTVSLTRKMFPFIFFIGLSAYMMGILNSLHNFATSALGPILLNLSMIFSIIFLIHYAQMDVHAMVIGVLVGGVLQCLVQIPSLYKEKVVPSFVWIRHGGVHKILRLMVPRLWGTAVYQISVFVDTIFASFTWIVGPGGQSALYYASRLFQLPLAIFGVALAQAVLPTLAIHHAQKNHTDYLSAVNFALRYVIYICLPASLGLTLFADEIVHVLFLRGEFDVYSADITSQALYFYSLGLVSCAFIKVLVSAFYAIQDTRTPVKTATLSLVLNVTLSFILMRVLKIGGLALSTTVSATCNAILLWVLLHRKVGSMDYRGIWDAFFKSLLSASFMYGTAFLWLKPWIQRSLDDHSLKSAIVLAGSIAICALVYYGVSRLAQSHEALQIRDMWLRPLFARRKSKSS